VSDGIVGAYHEIAISVLVLEVSTLYTDCGYPGKALRETRVLSEGEPAPSILIA
jgi:hypothetical protein